MKTIACCMFCLLVLGACSQRYQTQVYHPNIPQDRLYNAYQRDYAQCQLAAQRNVPYPRAYASPSPSRPMCNSNVPDLSCAMSGYYAAQNDPNRLYQQNINDYISACIQAKGYIVTQVPVTN